jgi:cell division protein FtsZ
MIHFDLPKEKSSIIKVIGVGGGGSNAVNHMHNQGIDGVNFIICNTDSQALAVSNVPNKVQLGPHLTQGLGAGANPEIGKQATEESMEEIRRIMEVNTKMVFITAGMGGGTGTGGAPIIAKTCKEMGILTVGIVTTPFAYEGKRRAEQAQLGINELRQHVDTLLVINNDKLRHQYGNLTMRSAFAKADNVLATAAKCITDVISSTGQINVDFADVCTVMRNGGVAILGNATVEGENRAQKAIEQALNSPLLNDNDISGARWILININSAEGENEFTMDEVEVIQNYLISKAGEGSDVILGMGYDNSLGAKIGITLIATGFTQKDPFGGKKEEVKVEKKEDEKIVMQLDMQAPVTSTTTPAPVSVVEEKQPEVIAPQAKQEEAEDEMAPKLVEVEMKQDLFSFMHPTVVQQNIEQAIEKEKEEEIIRFELSVVPPVEEEMKQPEPKADAPVVELKPTTTSVNTHASPASGGYLQKPANIYVEPEQEQAAPIQVKNEIPAAKPAATPINQEEEGLLEFKLVIKDPNAADELRSPQTQPPVASSVHPVEDPVIQDEAEELKRKAAERLQKLRNLSFNVNAADPNNEFESVPAYIRRNMEMYNHSSTVETFYTNYTVKTDENNKTQISTINTFLDGKKPD